jgi:hypothetical protein
MSVTATSAERGPLAEFEAPLVAATPASLAGYGRLVDDYARAEIEIVTWPAPGWRPVEPGTGNEGGTTEGVFEFEWCGEVLHGRNHAVGGNYVIAWTRQPDLASETAADPDRSRALVRHFNYHPDGGQLFFPKAPQPFVAPLALPGDDVRPEHFVAFYCDGTQGLYIHPGVWHAAVIPLDDKAEFLDKQGKVHARINCHIDREFGGYLAVPLRRP